MTAVYAEMRFPTFFYISEGAGLSAMYYRKSRTKLGGTKIRIFNFDLI